MSREDDDTPVDHRRDEVLDLEAIRARCRLRSEDRYVVTVDVPRMIIEIERLRERQQANLATIVKLANTVPFDDEIKNALEQRGKLLTEIGALRARVLELELAAAPRPTLKVWEMICPVMGCTNTIDPRHGWRLPTGEIVGCCDGHGGGDGPVDPNKPLAPSVWHEVQQRRTKNDDTKGGS